MPVGYRLTPARGVGCGVVADEYELPVQETDMDIEAALKELIVERLFLDIEPAEIETETELVEYGVDSFLLLELIVAMEEMFEIQFGQADITSETLKSVATMAELIRGKQG